MSTCTDNHRLGRIGCGATYSGNAGHCVAKVPWSEYPDGRAHITFTSDEASRRCWTGDTMRHPSTLINAKTKMPLLELDSRGRWRRFRGRRTTGEAQNSASNESGGLR